MERGKIDWDEASGSGSVGRCIRRKTIGGENAKGLQKVQSRRVVQTMTLGFTISFERNAITPSLSIEKWLISENLTIAEDAKELQEVQKRTLGETMTLGCHYLIRAKREHSVIEHRKVVDQRERHPPQGRPVGVSLTSP